MFGRGKDEAKNMTFFFLSSLLKGICYSLEFKDLIKLAIKEITSNRGRGRIFHVWQLKNIGIGQKYFHLQVGNELWALWRRLNLLNPQGSPYVGSVELFGS